MIPELKLELIHRSKLFKGVDEKVLTHLATFGLMVQLKKDQVLFRKGDAGDALFGVYSGKMAISILGPKDKKVWLNVLEPGEFLGEIAFLDGSPRTADASALEACRLLKIERRDFLPFLDQDPQLVRHLLSLLCERVRWSNGIIEDAWFFDFSARLAKRMIGLSYAHGVESDDGILIDINLSQSDLGHMAGGSRESVNKELKRWEGSGWIEKRDGHYLVKDTSALAKLVAIAAEEI